MVPEGWKEQKISELLQRVNRPVDVLEGSSYRQIGIRSHCKGIFHKDPVSGKSLGKKRIFYIEPECFIVNIVFAWEQAIAITSADEKGMVASHRFPMFKAIENNCDVNFVYYVFESKRGKYLLEVASPGGAGRNKTLGQSTFAEIKLLAPPHYEQKKIAQILATWDKAIATTEQLLANSQQQKKALMQQLLTGKKRMLDENGKPFSGEWRKFELGKLLDYKQPTPYLVSSTKYSDEHKTPVLTAGKTFLLGYTDEETGIFEEQLPVIIFDDFTTASKYVDFSFKAKSSAMKILIPKESVSARYVYEAMQMLNYPVGGHQRHWISIYSNLVIKVPEEEELTKITELFLKADQDINLLKAKVAYLKDEKKALIQQLLTGKRRVKLSEGV